MRVASSLRMAVAVLAAGVAVEAQDLGGGFLEVEVLGSEINSPFLEMQPAPSGDDLSLAFASDRPGGNGGPDIYVADRASTDELFSTVRNVRELNSSAADYATFLSYDGLTLYYMSNISGNFDMYVAVREAPGDLFVPGPPMDGINSGSHDGGLSLTADGLLACIVSQRPGGVGARDLWLASREAADGPFAEIRNLNEVNTPYDESYPSISADGLTLYWSDLVTGRPGGQGGLDIWYATRESRDKPFGQAINLRDPINTFATDYWPRVSAQWPQNGAPLYFNRCFGCSNDLDIYRAIWRVAPMFLRGDCNSDSDLDLSDAVYLLLYNFTAARAPGCAAACDANGDGSIASVTDAVYLLEFAFLGGAQPVGPFPGCGEGRLASDLELGCAEAQACP